MKIIAIINKNSGTIAHLPRLYRISYFRELFSELGVQADIRMVSGSRIRELARQAVNSDVDAIVAGGGDGTLSTVASEMIGTDKALGILPLGTLNHFAKDNDIPLLIDEAIKVIAQNYARACDVCEVNSLYFINNSSIGLYPHIVKEREAQREQLGRKKWLAMVSAAFYVFRRFPTLRVRINIDGHPEVLTTPFVFIGNNKYQIDLLTLGSRSELDRGEMSLYIANHTGRFGLLRMAIMALFGRLNQAKDFRMASATELSLVSKKRRLRVALDGEIIRLRPPLNYQIHPRALRVLVPPPIEIAL